MKIVRTPEPGHHGLVGNVQFVGGVAKVADDAQEMTYFRQAGYVIEDADEAVADAPTDEEAADLEALDEQGTEDPDPVVVEMPKKNAPADAWRAYAVNQGMADEEAAAYSRDDLVAHYSKEGGQ